MSKGIVSNNINLDFAIHDHETAYYFVSFYINNTPNYTMLNIHNNIIHVSLF